MDRASFDPGSSSCRVFSFPLWYLIFDLCSGTHFVSLFFQLVVEPSTWPKASSTALATRTFIPLTWNVSGTLSVPLATGSSCLFCKSFCVCVCGILFQCDWICRKEAPLLTERTTHSMCVQATVREHGGNFRKSASKFPLFSHSLGYKWYWNSPENASRALPNIMTKICLSP